MQTKKMSLANIKGKLSRAEMKNIMAGSGTCCCGTPDWSEQQCNLSKSDAQNCGSGMTHWCCASC